MQNDLVNALNQALNANQGETLDVPHPCDIAKISAIPATDWVKSVLDSDLEVSDMGAKINPVLGQIVEIVRLDEFGEPMGDLRVVVHHKYDSPYRKSQDVSVSLVKPVTAKALRARFPEAFEQYEKKLSREGRPTPIAFLDTVPPEVLNTLVGAGVYTIQDFASFDDSALADLSNRLNLAKLGNRSRFVADYRCRALEYVGEPSKSAVKTRKAA